MRECCAAKDGASGGAARTIPAVHVAGWYALGSKKSLAAQHFAFGSMGFGDPGGAEHVDKAAASLTAWPSAVA